MMSFFGVKGSKIDSTPLKAGDGHDMGKASEERLPETGLPRSTFKEQPCAGPRSFFGIKGSKIDSTPLKAGDGHDKGKASEERLPETALPCSTFEEQRFQEALPVSGLGKREKSVLMMEGRHSMFDLDSTKQFGSVLPACVVHSFETELFKGVVLFRTRSETKSKAYFENRSRLFSVIVSGQFKEPVKFTDAYTGQEFENSIDLPKPFIFKAVIGFMKMISPLLECTIGERSYFLSPIIQAAQVIHVSDTVLKLTPESELEENIYEHENLDPSLRNSADRKSFFAKRKNLDGRIFTPEKFYSFDFYNDLFDPETFTFKLFGHKIDLHPYIKRQPIKIIGKKKQVDEENRSYLWNFELIHKNSRKDKQPTKY